MYIILSLPVVCSPGGLGKVVFVLFLCLFGDTQQNCLFLSPPRHNKRLPHPQCQQKTDDCPGICSRWLVRNQTANYFCPTPRSLYWIRCCPTNITDRSRPRHLLASEWQRPQPSEFGAGTPADEVHNKGCSPGRMLKRKLSPIRMHLTHTLKGRLPRTQMQLSGLRK